MLPYGTGNDWIRTSGIPSDMAEAARCIVRGKTAKEDLVRLTFENGVFCMANIGGIGLDADICYHTNNLKRKGYKGDLLYKLVAPYSIFARKRSPVEIVCDGESVYKGKLYTAVIANGIYRGGGIKQNEEGGRWDDGLLELSVMGGVNRIKAIQLMMHVFSGDFAVLPGIITRRFRKMTVTPLGETSRVESDGEPHRGSYRQANQHHRAVMGKGTIWEARPGIAVELLRLVGWLVANTVQRPRVYGPKPKLDEPTIFAIRHVGMMDPLMLMVKYPGKVIHPLAALDYFEKNAFTRWFYKCAQCIPIDRNNGSKEWLDLSMAALACLRREAEQDRTGRAAFPLGSHHTGREERCPCDSGVERGLEVPAQLQAGLRRPHQHRAHARGMRRVRMATRTDRQDTGRRRGAGKEIPALEQPPQGDIAGFVQPHGLGRLEGRAELPAEIPLHQQVTHLHTEYHRKASLVGLECPAGGGGAEAVREHVAIVAAEARKHHVGGAVGLDDKVSRYGKGTLGVVLGLSERLVQRGEAGARLLEQDLRLDSGHAHVQAAHETATVIHERPRGNRRRRECQGRCSSC